MTTEEIVAAIEQRIGWLKYRENKAHGHGLDARIRATNQVEALLVELRTSLSLSPAALPTENFDPTIIRD